jgi:plastocyanin domain-containing protein
MSKTTSIIIAILILSGAFYYTNRDTTSPSPKTGSTQKVSNIPVENSVIKDGVQYITITAQSGYSPRMSTAKAGIPTKLVVKTNGTYDCSSSLVIRSLSYRNILPNTGETTIDAGTPKAGDTLQGVCGMGMFNFVVTFS